MEKITQEYIEAPFNIHDYKHTNENILKQEQMDEEEDNEVGSPSPPFEGIIREEAEKQLESNVGEFEASQTTNGNMDNVNFYLWKSFQKLKFDAFAKAFKRKVVQFSCKAFYSETSHFLFTFPRKLLKVFEAFHQTNFCPYRLQNNLVPNIPEWFRSESYWLWRHGTVSINGAERPREGTNWKENNAAWYSGIYRQRGYIHGKATLWNNWTPCHHGDSCIFYRLE